MHRTMLLGLLALAIFSHWSVTAAAADPDGAILARKLLIEASQALSKGQIDRAVELATSAIEADPEFARAYQSRGRMYEQLAKHEEAVADFTKAIELDAKLTEAYNHRGSELFKLGKIEESIADFDKYIESAPGEEREHWQRGISYYYAGRYEEGRKQFEGYQTFDNNDVENAVWRFLCMARAESPQAAQAALLPIKDDRRVPMMQVYRLFQGKLQPADVLKAAEGGGPKPEELNRRLFYAHLYIGLYLEATGKAAEAREHLEKARDRKIDHYMWDVARVHVERLDRAKPEAAKPAAEESK